jgi:hypothetical protein
VHASASTSIHAQTDDMHPQTDDMHPPNETARHLCIEYPLGVAVSARGDVAVSDWKANVLHLLAQGAALSRCSC